VLCQALRDLSSEVNRGFVVNDVDEVSVLRLTTRARDQHCELHMRLFGVSVDLQVPFNL
jgi:hypothetical protein